MKSQELLDGTDTARTKRSIKYGFAKFETFLRLKQLELPEIALADQASDWTVYCLNFTRAYVAREDGCLGTVKNPCRRLGMVCKDTFWDNFGEL